MSGETLIVNQQHKKRDKSWKRMRRSSTENRSDYKQARNEHGRIKRKEQKCEKDKIDKCGDKPILLCRFISKKIKHREGIVRQS